jgi:hypothetical protein
MSKYALSLGLIALVALAVIGCSRSEDPVGPLGESTQTVPIYGTFEWSGEGVPCGEELTVTLIAGQNYDIGTAVVTLDDGELCITLNTVNGWVMNETHVAVAPVLDSIPQTGSDNPQVGKFYFGTEHDPAVTTYTYCCDPLDFIWEPGEIFIAIHAAVVKLDENGDVIQEETAWAEGPEFPGRSWATYVNYQVNDCNGPGEECPLFVTWPNGGEEVCLDGPATITWDFFGESPTFVRIELLLDDFPCATIAESAPNTGSYEWFVLPCPGVPEDGYKIRITELGCGTIDDSDGPFQIIECGGGE